MERRTLLQTIAATGLVTSSGCSFFFPVPHDGTADNTPSQELFQMGRQFRPGERWVADVLVAGVKAGTIAASVGEPCRMGGRWVHTVHSVAGSAGLLGVIAKAGSDARTLVDASSGRPIRNVSYVDDGSKEVSFDVDFRADQFRSVYKRVGKKTQRRRQQYPTRDIPHDVHTAFGAMRVWQPDVGTRAHVFEVIGRRIWRADIAYTGIVIINSALGPKRARRIDGLATKLTKSFKPSGKPKKFSLWISDDDDQVPLRISGETKLGDLEVQVAAYAPPDAPLPDDVDAPPPEVATCPELFTEEELFALAEAEAEAEEKAAAEKRAEDDK